jgi:hypothetical protein
MSNSITEYLTKFIETKHKIAELEKRHEKYRKIVEEHMNSNDLKNLSHSIDDTSYTIKKSLSSRQTVCKKDVPPEVWERYCKTSSFSIISVTKDK